MQALATKPRDQLADRNYSNLIFTSGKKVVPQRNTSSPCARRSQSILLLRGNSKKADRLTPSPGPREEQVLEVSQDQKLNVINLLKGNNAMVPKLKSHYCKKITLSNLDKYYEHCVKTVRSGISSSMDIRPSELKKEEKDVQNTQKSEQKRVSLTAEGSRYRLQKFQLRKRGISENIQEASTPLLTCKRAMEATEDPSIFNYFSTPPAHSKFSYSTFCRRARKSKRYSQQPRKQKDQFAIDGWETPELVLQEDLMAE